MQWAIWAIVAMLLATAVVLARSPRGLSLSPEEVLKERYARGEIDGAEYRRRLDDLRR